MSGSKYSSDEMFKSPFCKKYWLCAFSELKRPKMLAIAAIMIALKLILRPLSIPVGENLTIYITFFVNALGSMIYGPVVAFIAGAVSDTLGSLIFPSGIYFFPFIFVEILGSFLYALVLWRQKLSVMRVVAARFSVTLICNLIVNPVVMIWYYDFLNNGRSYALVTLPRTVKNLALFPVESILLVLFLTALLPALKSLKLVSHDQPKLYMSLKHYLYIALLLVIAVVIVVCYYKFYLLK